MDWKHGQGTRDYKRKSEWELQMERWSMSLIFHFGIDDATVYRFIDKVELVEDHDLARDMFIDFGRKHKKKEVRKEIKYWITPLGNFKCSIEGGVINDCTEKILIYRCHSIDPKWSKWDAHLDIIGENNV